MSTSVVAMLNIVLERIISIKTTQKNGNESTFEDEFYGIHDRQPVKMNPFCVIEKEGKLQNCYYHPVMLIRNWNSVSNQRRTNPY